MAKTPERKYLSSLQKTSLLEMYDWNQAVTLKTDLDRLLNDDIDGIQFKEKLAELYSAGVLRKNRLDTMPGEPQRINSGMCTSSALAVLIRRYQILHDESPTFTFADVRRNMTGDHSLLNPTEYHNENMELDANLLKNKDLTEEEINQLLQNEKWQNHPIGPSYNITWYDSEGGHYTTERYDAKMPETAQELKELLENHPAGLYVYGRYNETRKHAIVITDCIPKEDGGWEFYCFDSAESGPSSEGDLLGMRTVLTASRLFYGNDSQMSRLLSQLETIVYMKDHDQIVRNNQF